MIQVLLSSSVTLETLPGAVKADPITVEFRNVTLARPGVMGVTRGGGRGPPGGGASGASGSAIPRKRSLCVNGGNMSAVPTRSHSPLPLAREFLRVTSPEPPTPIVGPLTLVKMLLVNVPLETDPGVPVT